MQTPQHHHTTHHLHHSNELRWPGAGIVDHLNKYNSNHKDIDHYRQNYNRPPQPQLSPQKKTPKTIQSKEVQAHGELGESRGTGVHYGFGSSWSLEALVTRRPGRFTEEAMLTFCTLLSFDEVK
jgi:hypothetical protein